MDSSAQKTNRDRTLMAVLLRFLHRRTATKMFAIVVLLLFSPILSLASSYGLSHLTQSDSHVVPKSAVPMAITVMTLTASPSTAFVGQEVTFFANASSDNPSASLTFTIFYEFYSADFSVNTNSPLTVNTTSSPGSVITKHTYPYVGNLSDGGVPPFYFIALMYVSDGTDNASTFVQVFVNFNGPPSFRSPPSDPLGTSSNLNTTMQIFIDDPDGDTVTVHWDFGDGTNATNVTVAPPFPDGVFVNQYHTWSPRIPGNPSNILYLLNVTLSDGFNPLVKSTTTVNVSLPLNLPPTFELLVSPTTVNPLQQVNVTANASDPEGDPLTWTFNYSDGTILVFSSDWSTPGKLIWQNDTHVFASRGNYTVTVSVSDALIPYQISYHNVSRSANIEVKVNVPPVLTVITLNPTSPEINAIIGYVDTKCSIDAIDADYDIMTLTWSLDGVVVGTNVSAGEKDFVKYVHIIRFNETGTYNISVTVTDGRPGHESGRYEVVTVTSNNQPPAVVSFTQSYVTGDFATPNEPVGFRLVATDPERDTIEVMWDFGDGSPLMYTNITVYIAGNATIFVNHTFSQIGNYSVRIFLTDNELGAYNHTLTYEIPIRVSMGVPKIDIVWDWWDFTSLGLVIMIPVGMVLWAIELRVHRKRIEDQGMSLDEYKLRREIESEELKKQ